MKTENGSTFKPFLTGSRVYGLPRFNSDIDLVIYVTKGELDHLAAQADPLSNTPDDENYVRAGSASLHFGNLNLICCTDEAYYRIWRKGTILLKKQKPVNRDFAIEFFKKLRSSAGLHID